MMTSDMLRGTIDILILSCLVQQPSYGYQILHTIAEHTDGSLQIKETTLYSAFRRLEKSGDIASFQGEVTHGRPRTYYQLTDQGQQTFQQLSQDWAQTVHLVNAFVTNPPTPSPHV